MRILHNFDLTAYNSYRIKSVCKKAIFPDTEEDIVKFFSDNLDKKPIILGGGCNVIFAQEYYEEDFVIFNDNFSAVNLLENNVIEAEAGLSLLKLSEFALENSLSGLEVFNDIPGTVGGAVIMNAGASGEEIKDVLIKVRYLDLLDMQIKELYNDEIGFEYRNTYFQKNTNNIVLKAWLQLQPKSKSEIESKIQELKSKRWEKQPREFPNAGSVFKRPKGYFVGQMIDELGLKGFIIGGAQISRKHGGFIVNIGNATGKDVLAVINEVKKQVLIRFGVNLEIEQRIV